MFSEGVNFFLTRSQVSHFSLMGIFPGKAVTDIGEKVVYHTAGAGCPKPVFTAS
jgi:hypothetical protein